MPRRIEPVEALVIPSQRLRDLMVQEAELGERIMRALILRRVGLLESGTSGPIIIGHAGNGDVLRLQGFLARNGQPHRVLDPDSDSCAQTLIERFHVDPHHLPIVLCPNGKLLRNPGENELARCIGLVRPIDPDKLYDVAIVGAGPAGLAAAVYAASEGLSAIVLDCRAFGGQAGASARIENYLGFPTGITGMALMARAYNQAQKFGVEMAIPDEAKLLGGGERRGGDHLRCSVGDDETRAGARRGDRQRRALPPARRRQPGGVRGIVACTTGPRRSRRGCAPARRWRWSAPAIRPARRRSTWPARSKKVWLLVRGQSLDGHHVALSGRAHRGAAEHRGADRDRDRRRWRARTAISSACAGATAPGEEDTRPIRHLFLFIGADPNTDWLAQCDVALDAKGFVRTGADDGRGRHPLETSRSGVFAIGDVRSGSVKRVAAAVGEGAQVVAALARLSRASRQRSAPQTGQENLMADECRHARDIRT